MVTAVGEPVRSRSSTGPDGGAAGPKAGLTGSGTHAPGVDVEILQSACGLAGIREVRGCLKIRLMARLELTPELNAYVNRPAAIDGVKEIDLHIEEFRPFSGGPWLPRMPPRRREIRDGSRRCGCLP